MTEQTATDLVAQKRREEMEARTAWIKDLSNLDWKKLPPHIMAQILTKKPYRGKKGEPDYYLSLEQALVFALRSFELDLSPLSSEVWFDRDRWTTNVTLEGQIVLARRRGMTGAPAFKDVKRPWKTGAVKLLGFAEEPGKVCTVKVGDGECAYTCWLSEWMVTSSPVWQAKPDHMLMVRSYEKALEFSGGVGVSGMPDERNIEGFTGELPVVDVKSLSAAPERMPYAQPGWNKNLESTGGVIGIRESLEPALKESIKQAQEKK